MISKLRPQRHELLYATLATICVSVILGVILPNTQSGLAGFAFVWCVLFILYSMGKNWHAYQQRRLWLWLAQYCALLVVGVVVYFAISGLRIGAPR